MVQFFLLCTLLALRDVAALQDSALEWSGFIAAT
jgi:hypothetical protein